jgi:four helix bundle suffix protein
MHSSEKLSSPNRPFAPYGGFEKLKGYQIAEVIYLATEYFCERFYANDRRMTDQMVQAARSGVRNISEGSGASGTSKKSEMLLTNVALSSLKAELLPDYLHFLRKRKLRIWDKDESLTRELRRRLREHRCNEIAKPRDGAVPFTGLDDLPEFVQRADPEIAANAMICAIHQATYLINLQLKSQRRDFEENGGFGEELYRSRKRRQRGA